MAAGFGESDNESPIRIGSTVYCVTCFDDQIRGEVLCFDETSKLMAIKYSNGGRKNTCDVTFVNLDFVKQLDVIQQPQQSKPPLKELPPLSVVKIRKREEEAIRERKLRLEKGISEEGIQIYRAISKTLKCSWQEKSLLVEGVFIDPPYGVTDCRSTNLRETSANSLDYIKKVVGKFYTDQQNGATLET